MTNASVAELIVATQAIRNGFNAYFPFSGASKCDLILEREGKLKRIQTKKLWKNKRGNKVCQAVSQSYNRRTRKAYLPYGQNEIDFLVAVEIETNDCWIIPIIDLTGITSNISLDSRSKNKNNWELVY